MNAANGSERTTYVFEDFRLDAARRMLYRGAEEVALAPKTIETLIALVERSGEIVSKTDLMQAIWADAAVEESNLLHHLHVLRKALGETTNGKPFIETFRRRGYRFNAEVQIVSERTESKIVRETAENSRPPFNRTARAENNFRLADSKNDRNETKPAAAQVSLSKPRLFLAAAALAAVFLMTSASFFWLNPASNVESKRTELSVTRLTNGNEPQEATVSPDGDYFVYHEFDGETSRLWLQRTGGASRLEITPPLKKHIGGKTFSPDGAFVYFTARNDADEAFALYRVSKLGGAPTKILDDVGSPVSFSPDGKEMVFHRSNARTGESALVIASSDGKDERILLSRAAAREILLFPAWSPDGGRIAFSVGDAEGDSEVYRAIVGINPQTGAIERLSSEKWDTCYRIVWTADAQGLIFVGTKYVEALTTRRDQIYYLTIATGEARRLTTDGYRYGTASLGVTKDDRVIAVPLSRASQIWQMSANGDARTAQQITNGQADGRAGIAPLADGRVGYIARAGENLSVWLMNADGADQKQLINDPPQQLELRAASNENFFVFTAEEQRQRDRRGRLFRANADGSDLRQLTFGDTNPVDSTVSPDGDWIVYYTDVFEGGSVRHPLWKIPATGGEPVRLGNENCTTPHFSPDGKSLSCVQGEKIFVLSAADGAVLKTFETIPNPTLNVGARWTPDGQNLVYIAVRNNVGNLWLQPIGGTAARSLTDFTSGSIYNFAFSSDGARLYVARGNQINDAVLISNFR